MAKKVAKTKRDPDFPLSLHKATGQYCKKVNQRVYYFGTDRAEAAKRWHTEKDGIYAGVTTPGRRGDGNKLVELGNVFIDAQRQRNRLTGKPGKRHIDLCEQTIKRLVEFVGAGCIVDNLDPAAYAKIKARLFEPVKRVKPVRGKIYGRTVKRRSPETVAGDVRRIKIFLNWCHKLKHISEPDYGDQFATETEVAITKESLRAQTEGKALAAADITKLIDAASVRFKPLLLLAINSGIGNADIAAIDWNDIKGIDLSECWIDLPRLKTGAPRRFVLWPETQTAIREYLPVRGRYAGDMNADLVFLTAHGIPWVRGEGESDRADSIGTTFRKLRIEAGLSRGTFYDLRRTFATIGSETLDFATVQLLMGHKKNAKDMTARYAQGVSDERIKRVCDHVRTWLYGSAVSQ